MPDPFPNSSLIDLLDAVQEVAIKKAIEDMLAEALVTGFPKARFDELQRIVMDRVNELCTTFLKGKRAIIPPLKLELESDSKPVIVKLRRYNESQR